MKFAIKKAVLNPHDPKRSTYDEGEVIGIVDGDNDYDAAMRTCRNFFKSTVLPMRETGWPGEGGLFFSAKLKKHGRVKDQPFFLKVGR